MRPGGTPIIFSALLRASACAAAAIKAAEAGEYTMAGDCCCIKADVGE